MGKPLVFMMGRSPAFLPTDRQYTRGHMWALAIERDYRFGLSAYAVRLLGDLRHLDWSVEPGSEVGQGQPIGTVEASKATSDLYAPMTGVLTQINADVLADPTLINSDLYEGGWLLAIRGTAATLLSPQAYLAHIEAGWPLAQRMLKGQLARRQAADGQ